MKLTIVLMTAFLMQVSASTHAQLLTLKDDHINLKQVFSQIRKQTGYTVFYKTDLISSKKPIRIELINVPLTEALTKILAGQNLDYTIQNKAITISEKEQPSFLEKIVAQFQAKEITGQVVDSLGNSLAGATIQVRGKNLATITSSSGKFNLKGVDQGDVLIASFIGYEHKMITVDDNNDYVFLLAQTLNKLDQVVVQGYGVTTQRLTTGNIGKVTAAEIGRQPVMNPLLALQGKVAGLDVNLKNGYASAPIKVELRGRKAIGDFPSDPLYVIDGVPLTVIDVGGTSNYRNGSVGYTQTGNNGPAGGQSPFFNLNPADIESIEVLKDADATAIYGSRGANGVILISTKRGVAGSTKLDFSIQQGVTRVTRYFDLLSTQQYLEMRREAFKNTNTTPGSGDAFDLLQWDSTRDVNWQKEIFGGMGKSTDFQAGISGGNSQTTFKLGTAYNHTTNINTVSGADQRGSVSLNLNHHSSDNKFTVSSSTSYSLTRSDMLNLGSAILLAPNAPAIFDDHGNLNYSGWGEGNSAARALFPFAGLKQPYKANTTFLNSSLNFNYEILKGLFAAVSLGYSSVQSTQQQYNFIASKDPLSNPTGDAFWGINNNNNRIIEPKVTYSNLIGKGRLEVLAGGSSQQANTNSIGINSDGYATDQAIKSLSNAKNQHSDQREGIYRYAGVFGRVNYNWDNKYILNISGRRDGSSRFGTGKQFGNFAALGVAWIFTEEKWLKENMSFLSFGKLRGSYGTTGSDAVGDYQYLSRWSSNSVTSYNNIVGYIPTQHANPNYQWQVNKKLEGGLSIGFAQDRITLDVAHYRDRVGNQLVTFPTPSYTGFSGVTANSPALIQNSGWEFNTYARLIESKGFSWSMNFNIGINKNKLLAYPNLELSPYQGRYIIGQPVNTVRILHYTGVDHVTGEYTFEDKNGDGKIDIGGAEAGRTDDGYVLDLAPKFIGGSGMNFSYKGISLIAFFNFKKQKGISGQGYGNGVPGTLNSNQPSSIVNRWQKPGDAKPTARYTNEGKESDNLFQYFSDGTYTDASYIRLSNLSISYSLPDKYIKSLGLKACSLFINSNNLFVITGYNGIDPETQVIGGLPPTRTIVGGLKLNF